MGRRNRGKANGAGPAIDDAGQPADGNAGNAGNHADDTARDRGADAGSAVVDLSVTGDAPDAGGGDREPGERKPRADRGRPRGPRRAAKEKVDLTGFIAENLFSAH